VDVVEPVRSRKRKADEDEVVVQEEGGVEQQGDSEPEQASSVSGSLSAKLTNSIQRAESRFVTQTLPNGKLLVSDTTTGKSEVLVVDSPTASRSTIRSGLPLEETRADTDYLFNNRDVNVGDDDSQTRLQLSSLNGMSDLATVLGKRKAKVAASVVSRVDSNFDRRSNISSTMALCEIVLRLKEIDSDLSPMAKAVLDVVSQVLYVRDVEGESVAIHMLEGFQGKASGDLPVSFAIDPAMLSRARHSAGLNAGGGGRRAVASSKSSRSCSHCGINASHDSEHCWMLHPEQRPAAKFAKKSASAGKLSSTQTSNA
jgi:hypothetical protein